MTENDTYPIDVYGFHTEMGHLAVENSSID